MKHLKACLWCKQWVCNDCGTVRRRANPEVRDPYCPTCKSRNGYFRDQLHWPKVYEAHRAEFWEMSP